MMNLLLTESFYTAWEEKQRWGAKQKQRRNLGVMKEKSYFIQIREPNADGFVTRMTCMLRQT